MRKICLALIFTTACASVPLHPINWATLIADAQFGVTEACSQNWIPANACTLITDALTAASAAIAKDPSMAQAIINKIITDIEAILQNRSNVVNPNQDPTNGIDYIDWLRKQ